MGFFWGVEVVSIVVLGLVWNSVGGLVSGLRRGVVVVVVLLYIFEVLVLCLLFGVIVIVFRRWGVFCFYFVRVWEKGFRVF